MYDTGEYAGTRLNGTIVMLKRKPIYVEHVYCDKTVKGYALDKIKRIVECHLDDLAVLDFQLGFVNTSSGAHYLSRKALRHDWRQGLRPNNIMAVPYCGRVDHSLIATCLRHRYPSFATAVAVVKSGDVLSCAWCQDFALTSTDKILWKNYEVGTIGDTSIRLEPNFRFLAKLLRENTYECYEIV
jgi:hypothetical protein